MYIQGTSQEQAYHPQNIVIQIKEFTSTHDKYTDQVIQMKEIKTTHLSTPSKPKDGSQLAY